LCLDKAVFLLQSICKFNMASANRATTVR
jgi:hypothetical protein